MKLTCLPLIAFAVAACSAHPQSTEPTAPAAADATPQSAGADDINDAPIDVPPLITRCGANSARISFTSPDTTQASFTKADGKNLILQTPPGVEDYTAVVMGCSSNVARKSYLVVQHGQFTNDCQAARRRYPQRVRCIGIDRDA